MTVSEGTARIRRRTFLLGSLSSFAITPVAGCRSFVDWMGAADNSEFTPTIHTSGGADGSFLHMSREGERYVGTLTLGVEV